MTIIFLVDSFLFYNLNDTICLEYVCVCVFFSEYIIYGFV